MLLYFENKIFAIYLDQYFLSIFGDIIVIKVYVMDSLPINIEKKEFS